MFSLHIAMGVLAFFAANAAAEPIKPPLELLYVPGNVLVAGTLTEINPDGHLVFERHDVLGGRDVPDLIDVRAPPATHAAAKLGERYIIGYSVARPDPRHPDKTVINPQGAIVLTSIGLDPALFRDTAQVREILEAGRSERGRESEHLVDLLMKALADGDASLQNLAAGEIVLEAQIGKRLHKDGRSEVIENVARDPRTPFAIRAMLLQAAAARPREFGDWWRHCATEVVETTPVGGYAPATSDAAGLARVALELLDRHAVNLSPDMLQRWMVAPDPAVVERVCLMLRRQSPALERSAIQGALASTVLPQQTRKFLKDHLRRLDLLDARLKARKDGTG